jgi:fibrillarin-like rRNA methylase
MAHFAKLGTGNIVETVEVVSNDIATTEQAGVDFLNNLYKQEMFGNKLLTIIILEKTLLVLVFNMTKQEMLLFHLNLLTLGY